MFRPYLSCDIETTGIPVDGFSPQIIEVCMIFDDMGYCNLPDRLKLHLYIKHEELTWQNDEVKDSNSHLLKEIESKGITLTEAREEIKKFIGRCRILNDGYDISLAAKNANNLVVPCMKLNKLDVNGISWKGIDVPSLYFLDFGKIPTFHEIAKKFSLNHDGTCMQDAEFICSAIQKKVYGSLGM